MNDKLDGLKLDELLEYIGQNEYISVPQLQAECELTYTEALAVMEHLSDRCLVAASDGSIERKVDTLRLNARELAMDECFELYTNEAPELLELVFILHDRAEDKSVVLHGDAELYIDLYLRAESLGLVHTFEGEWYSSITKRAVERLKRLLNESGNLLTAAIARPVFDACREGRLDCEKIFECCLLPDLCRILIEGWLKKYRESGCIPNTDKRTILSYAQRDEVATELLNEYLRKYDFSTKWEYLAQAKQGFEILNDDPAVPLYFKLAAKEVVRRLDAEFDTDSLKRQKYILENGEEEELYIDDDDDFLLDLDDDFFADDDDDDDTDDE